MKEYGLNPIYTTKVNASVRCLAERCECFKGFFTMFLQHVNVMSPTEWVSCLESMYLKATLTKTYTWPDITSVTLEGFVSVQTQL